MGERANYIYVKDGITKLSTDRWGAGSMWLFALSGSKETISYLQSLDSVEQSELRDDVWSEGALLVNEDKKQFVVYMSLCHVSYKEDQGNLTIFNTFPGNVVLNQRFSDMVQASWEGWQIKLADQKYFGVSENICIDFDNIPAERMPSPEEIAEFPLTKEETYHGFTKIYLSYTSSNISGMIAKFLENNQKKGFEIQHVALDLLDEPHVTDEFSQRLETVQRIFRNLKG